MQIGAVTMFWCAILVGVLCSSAVVRVHGVALNHADEDLSLRDQVTLLNKQVRALLDRRREDVELIEQNMRKSLAKNSELATLRTEMDHLRHEMQQLRSGDGSATGEAVHGNRETNDHLTVKWLSDAVSELRTELSEMQYTQNASVMLQRREAVDSELKLLRTDLLNMNKELEGVRTEQLKYEATLGQLMEEVTSVRDSERATAVLCAKTRNQLKSIQVEWTYNLQRASSVGDNAKPLPDEVLKAETESMHKSRHQRLLRKHIMQLQRANQNITKQQAIFEDKLATLGAILSKKRPSGGIETRLKEIESRVERVEKDMNSVERLQHPEAGGNQVVHDNNLMGRLTKLETQQKQTALSMFNMSRQVSSFDRLHRSILELLESVETLENKVDKTVPDFRKEISQLEFNMAQTLSELALMKEDQSNSMQSVKAIGVGVSALRDKVELDHETLEQLNITMSLLQASNYIQNSKLHDHILKTESSQLPEGYANLNSTSNIVQELEEVENEYHSIINKLPHDCTSVNGPSGLYLISPGAGEPVMAACEGGWTTVQRRRDGSIDFNRNWDEYSRGFGSASGEFWIGNRVLNRLTRDNCTRLRIDMVDIYGKSFHAEYEEFLVESLSNGYRLHVSGYSGNSSDALDYQNRMEFSAIDNDRDISNTHCASNYEGGWWFSHCQHANLNGKYNLGLTWFDNSRNEWIAVATSEMKVKRRQGCELQ